MPSITELQSMRAFVESGATLSLDYRKALLKKWYDVIWQHQEEIQQALFQDLHKSKEESWVTEIGLVLSEIQLAIKQLHQWAKPQRTSTNLLNWPSRSYILKEPMGTVLIIAPWNYPFLLLMSPLAAAIAAGNVAVVKPTEFAPATTAISKQIIEKVFTPQQVLCCEGDGAVVIPELMRSFRFDHVFFTGSPVVGQKIYALAAEQLVPVTLELGGKSPCIVEPDANLTVTAKRICSTKFSNAGQMCVAPDYILVHSKQKAALLEALKKTLQDFFGKDAGQSYDYGRIINQRQFNRLEQYLKEGTIFCGGKKDVETLYFEPTIITNVSLESPLMHEEIFGPILPVLEVKDDAQIREIIARNPNPLALYVFTQNSERAKYWTSTIPFGGGCINNAALHFTNHALPFGGRGRSGIGKGHGKFGFDSFSHTKAILSSPTWFDPKIKYPTFKGKLGLLKRFIK